MFATLIAMFSSREKPDLRTISGVSLVVMGIVLLTY
jgi:uncharacterized membrane protein